MASNASREAAEFGLEATREAQRNIREMYEQDREDFRPYREAGTGALGRLTGMFESSPRYDLPQSVQRRLTGPGDTYTPVSPGMQSLARLTGTAPRSIGAGQTPEADAVPALRPRTPNVSTTMPVDQPGRRLGPATLDRETGVSAELVTFQAPTGQTFQAPAAKIAFYEQQGARRIA